MSTAANSTFNTRAFVACMAVCSGISLPLTGIANHILGFDPLTIERESWMAAHNVMGLLFAVFVTWHIVLNRRALVHHIRAAATASREAKAATVVTGLLLFLAVIHPFLVRAGH